jgi:hypothetical protein
MLAIIRKRSFLNFAGVRVATSSAPKARIIRPIISESAEVYFGVEGGKQRNPAVRATGFRYGNLRQAATSKLVLTWHEAVIVV